MTTPNPTMMTPNQMKTSDAERQSAPTGAQNSAAEQEADRPLGGAACSFLFSSSKGDMILTDSFMAYVEDIRILVKGNSQTSTKLVMNDGKEISFRAEDASVILAALRKRLSPIQG